MFTHIAHKNLPIAVDTTLASGKRFYTTPDGSQYPSITTILGAKEKPWLANWRNMLGEDKAAKETQRCADRGTAVHAMAERYLNNEDPSTFIKEYDPVHVSDFNKLKIALNKINNIHGQEIALFSDNLKAAGRVDCIGEYNNKLSIIDFKTSNNNKSEDMIEDYFNQCTAYSIMWEEMTGIKINNIVILMAVEKGIVPLIFTSSMDDHIEQLVKRVVEFHRTQAG